MKREKPGAWCDVFCVLSLDSANLDGPPAYASSDCSPGTFSPCCFCRKLDKERILRFLVFFPLFYFYILKKKKKAWPSHRPSSQIYCPIKGWQESMRPTSPSSSLPSISAQLIQTVIQGNGKRLNTDCTDSGLCCGYPEENLV